MAGKVGYQKNLTVLPDSGFIPFIINRDISLQQNPYKKTTPKSLTESTFCG